MKPSLEVADIFRQFGPTYRAQHGAHMPIEQLRAMHAIEVCRTAELGGHVETCDHCDGKRISYNSCRNRHCPKCQGLDKERWRQARHQDLLPTPYFHVVFTLPQALRPLALRNQEVVYSLLFKAASQALLELGRDRKYLGGQTASRRCCTPGRKRWPTTRICTALCPVVACPSMATGGYPHASPSLFRSKRSPPCSAAR